MTDLLTTKDLKRVVKPSTKWRNLYLFKPTSPDHYLEFDEDDGDFTPGFELEEPGQYWAHVMWPSKEIAIQKAIETIDPFNWSDAGVKPWMGINQVFIHIGAYEDG